MIPLPSGSEIIAVFFIITAFIMTCVGGCLKLADVLLVPWVWVVSPVPVTLIVIILVAGINAIRKP